MGEVAWKNGKRGEKHRVRNLKWKPQQIRCRSRFLLFGFTHWLFIGLWFCARSQGHTKNNTKFLPKRYSLSSCLGGKNREAQKGQSLARTEMISYTRRANGHSLSWSQLGSSEQSHPFHPVLHRLDSLVCFCSLAATCSFPILIPQTLLLMDHNHLYL